MILTDYSFVMAVIWSSIFAVFLAICRKNTTFIYRFGISSIWFLCAGFFARILVPFEFLFVKEINLRGLVAGIYEIFLYNISEDRGIFVYHIICVMWLFIAVLLAAYKFIQYFRFVKGIRRLENKVSIQLMTYKKMIEAELGGIEAELICSPGISVPMCTGIKKKLIMLPERTYQNAELYYILKHEYTHLKNKDIHIKMIVEAFIVLFWWNPFVYLLRHNLSQVLEVKCDLAVVGNKTLKEKAAYLKAIINTIKGSSKKAFHYQVITAEFAQSEQQTKIKQRFNFVVGYDKNNQERKIASFLFGGMILATVLLSYMFVIQPSYDPPVADMTEVGYEITADNAYIIENKDGSYVVRDHLGEENEVSEEMRKMMIKSGFKVRRR